MLVLIVFLPIFSFLISIFFGRRLSKGVLFLTCINVFSSFAISLYNLIFIIGNDSTVYIPYFKWLVSDTLDVTWGFYCDSITAIMLVVVTFISSIVHLYSTEYMKEDPHIQRFMSYLSLFTFFYVNSCNCRQLSSNVCWLGRSRFSVVFIN